MWQTIDAELVHSCDSSKFAATSCDQQILRLTTQNQWHNKIATFTERKSLCTTFPSEYIKYHTLEQDDKLDSAVPPVTWTPRQSRENLISLCHQTFNRVFNVSLANITSTFSLSTRTTTYYHWPATRLMTSQSVHCPDFPLLPDRPAFRSLAF